MHLKCQFFLIYKTILFRNGDGCQSAERRYIVMQSTSQMRKPLEIFSMQYEKNPLKAVGGDG